MEKEISIYLLKLRRSHPFLATISLFAQYEFSDQIEQSETDALVIRINPVYFGQLKSDEKTGLLLHLTLHAALLHPIRQGLRRPVVWNMAADIVVNNIILETQIFTPPQNTATEPKYSDLSVEQVYEALMQLHKKNPSIHQAAMAAPNCPDNDKNQNKKSNVKSNKEDKNTTINNTQPNPYQVEQTLQKLYPFHPDLSNPQNKAAGSKQQNQSDQQKSTSKPSTDIQKFNAQCTQHWQNALRKAEIAALYSGQQQGQTPLGLAREIDLMLNPVIDWRWMLWNFIVRTPDDYSGFDRRFVHQGLYLDALESEKLHVLVAIDTSGSIEKEELTRFMSELSAICNTYHFIQVTLYYVDADIYGPFELSSFEHHLVPVGGGGTDFDIFFEEVVSTYDIHELDLVVYFTDGFGEFPATTPEVDTLWVITMDGLEDHEFPFGQIARLANETY